MKPSATVVRPTCPACGLTFPVGVDFADGGRRDGAYVLNVEIDRLAVAAHVAQHREEQP